MAVCSLTMWIAPLLTLIVKKRKQNPGKRPHWILQTLRCSDQKMTPRASRERQKLSLRVTKYSEEVTVAKKTQQVQLPQLKRTS